MSKKTHSQLCTQVMELFVNNGLRDIIAKGTIEELANEVQQAVEVLSFVQARVISTYLIRMLHEGDTDQEISTAADMIIEDTSDLLDRSITGDLARMVEQLKDMAEDMDSKGQTSH